MKVIKIKWICNIIIPTIMIISWLWVLFFFIWNDNTISAYDSRNPRESQEDLWTSVSVRITNDFVWYIKRWQSLWSQFFTWGKRWTSTPNIYVRAWANRTSSYQLSWWITWSWAWGWVDTYDKSQFTILSWDDGTKYIYVDYTTIRGKYHTWVVSVGLDRIWPSRPNVSFMSWVIMNSPFIISWDDGDIDTWVGREKYIIHISLDPNFLWEIKKDLYTENYYIDTNDLPLGTIRWYIETVDYLWNSTPSAVQYFHNTLPSIPNHQSPNIPDDMKNYYWKIDSDKSIQDISTWTIKNIFDIMTNPSDTWTKVIYDDNIKSILIYNYLVHGVADTWIIPTWVPKSWVDGIGRYLDKIVQDTNQQIQNPKKPVNRTLYIIIWWILLALCLIVIIKSRQWDVDKLCD